jgi:uncharacterized membrane protein
MADMGPSAVMAISVLGEALSITDATQSTGAWLAFSIIAAVALAVVCVLSWRERERRSRD